MIRWAIILITFFNLHAQDNLSDPQIEFTALSRIMINDEYFQESPYSFLLFDTDYSLNEWKFSGGFFAQKGLAYPDLPLNHLYADYYGDTTRLRIGKTFTKIGVMDYFSLLDTANPIRSEFFDDPKMSIKKIPVWMAQVDLPPSENLNVSFILQPYDASLLDNSGFYVDYALHQLIPNHYKEFFNHAQLGDSLFTPTYNNTISPYIAHSIESKKSTSQWNIHTTSFGLVSEYADDSMKIGAVAFNRYTEIPLIIIDQNLLNAAKDYENESNAYDDLSTYLGSMDIDPIEAVEPFRYTLLGLYGESTLERFGIRGEISHRNKIPLLNEYSALSSAGFALDYLDDSFYTSLESQWLYLKRYRTAGMISMLTTKFEPFVWSSFKTHLETRFIGAYLDAASDISFNPSLHIEYGENGALTIQGVFSRENRATNGISILLRGVF